MLNSWEPYSTACVHVQFPFAEPVWDEYIELYGVKAAVKMLVRYFFLSTLGECHEFCC